MELMTQIAQLILSLSFLVAIHEFGHLLSAKYFGMRVEQFSIGFPPKLWSFRKGETEYAISAIPLGGYVKISGMIDESLDKETMNQPPQPWEFRSKPAWQRLIVMLGGITVNLVVGVLIFIVITWVYGDSFTRKDVVNTSGGFYVGPAGEKIGMQTGDQIIKLNGKDFKYVEDLMRPENLLVDNPSITILRDGKEQTLNIPTDFIKDLAKKDVPGNFISIRVQPVIGEVAKNSLAEKLNLQVGDEFLEVNHQPVKYQDEVTRILRSSTSDSVHFRIRRSNQEQTYQAKFLNDKHEIGFRSKISEEFKTQAEEVIQYNLLESVPKGTARAFTMLGVQITAFGKIFKGELPWRESVSGPIGIVSAFSKKWDWHSFWNLTGLLSLVLAFFNILPIPALDGGHILFLSFELISGRKPSDKFLEIAQKTGMVILLTLILIIITNDILKRFDI